MWGVCPDSVPTFRPKRILVQTPLLRSSHQYNLCTLLNMTSAAPLSVTLVHLKCNMLKNQKFLKISLLSISNCCTINFHHHTNEHCQKEKTNCTENEDWRLFIWKIRFDVFSFVNYLGFDKADFQNYSWGSNLFFKRARKNFEK